MDTHFDVKLGGTVVPPNLGFQNDQKYMMCMSTYFDIEISGTTVPPNLDSQNDAKCILWTHI